MKLLSLLRTSKRLGWRNCASVAKHRVALHSGLHHLASPIEPCPVPEPLRGSREQDNLPSYSWFLASREACLSVADALLIGRATWFSHEIHEIGSPPDWFLDPASGLRFPDSSQHWSRCRPFSGADIKRCWELSRWGWAPLFARAWLFSGDSYYRDGLNAWSQSWCEANPVNGGSNWLCGQECSIRLLHALQAWHLSDAPGYVPTCNPERAAFVSAHLTRISATVHYAQSQENNHWSSEAAALFIGGSWLAANSSLYASSGRQWAKAGRLSLEQSVGRLVMADGSFSQHSLTYHRLLLDTLSQAVLWCRWLDLDPFSERFFSHCLAATSWLTSMVDPISGDGPNLGNNDGAFCYTLHSQDYRDFRPTIQLASVLFRGYPVFQDGPWDEPLHWLGLSVSRSLDSALGTTSSNVITMFKDGGYATLRPSVSCWALLRLPTYRFRPAHADPLHFDLWHRGVNLLRDGGSYAYNASSDDLAIFPGITTHNTVHFDGAEPMLRLGRFLWGDWVKLEASPQVEVLSINAAYRCPFGRHQRQVMVDATGKAWTITDTCSAFRTQALLRWRLCPGEWSLDGSTLISSMATLQVQCDQPIVRLELISGWESQYYGAKTPLPVLEVAVEHAPAVFITSILLPS